MAKRSSAWVLDTDTKGTGAQMVPLEKVETGLPPRPRRTYAPTKVEPEAKSKTPKPKQPSIFKVVDALSRQVLAEGTGVRATVDLLEDVRSVVDVSIYLWEHGAQKWRPLTLAERQTLFKLRGR